MTLIVKRTQTLLFTSFFLFLGILFFVPEGIAEAAGVVPCGGRGEPVCTLCHFIVGIHGIIDWFMRVMVFVALAIMTAMAVLYIVSGGNEGLTKTAKGGIANALIGILIVLFAWLIVNVLMFIVLPTNDDLGVGAQFKLTSGFQFNCSTDSTAGTALGGVPGVNGGTPGSGSGECTPLTSGPCSVDNLAKYFGSEERARQASGICNAESRGSITIGSGVDKCHPNGEVVSWGLFQINISANKVGGLDCPSAFSSMYTGSNKNCQVTNIDLYRECVAEAKKSDSNIRAAVEEYNEGGWGRWGANSKCGY